MQILIQLNLPGVSLIISQISLYQVARNSKKDKNALCIFSIRGAVVIEKHFITLLLLALVIDL